VSSAPKTIRWRDAIMDNTALSWRAKASAMGLARHADLDGLNCYPGASKCAAEMSVSRDTILRGWDELKEAGYLQILPLPEGRRRTHGAVKVMRFPALVSSQLPGSSQRAVLVADSNPTYSGNHGQPDPPGGLTSTREMAMESTTGEQQYQAPVSAQQAPRLSSGGCLVCSEGTPAGHLLCTTHAGTAEGTAAWQAWKVGA
jgi:hypothetical protein